MDCWYLSSAIELNYAPGQGKVREADPPCKILDCPEMTNLDDKRTRILLIEDDESDVFLVREILAPRDGSQRYEIRSAGTLADGEALIASWQPDAILLDLTLPDATGLASLERLKRVAGDVPVVILSNMTDEDLAVEAVKRGAQDFLVKGQVEAMRLSRIIRYAMERAKLLVGAKTP